MSPLRRLLFIILLTSLWSPSFLFIKIAVQELPPLTIVFMRVTIAAVLMCFILLIKKRSLPTHPMFWFHAACMAMASSILPFYLFSVAEQSIDSAMAAILNATSPLFTLTLAYFFCPEDRIQPHKIVGLFISIAGLLILFSPNILEGLSGTTLGMLAGAAAAFFYAVSHVYAKKYMVGQKPFILPASQLLMSSLILLPITFWIDAPLSLTLPSYAAIGAICGLALLGTTIAFIVYYHLIDHCGPTAISMVACFFPVGGMFLGWFFLNEQLSPIHFAGAVLILFGMMIVNEVIRIKAFERKRVSESS